MMEEELIYQDNYQQHSSQSYDNQANNYDEELDFQNNEIQFNLSSSPLSSSSSSSSQNTTSQSDQDIHHDQSTQQVTRQNSSSLTNNQELSTVAIMNNHSNNNQKQKVIFINIPVQKYLFNQREYLLNGDILMNFNFQEFQRIGNFNKYKRMAMLQIDKSIDQLNIHMTNYQKGVDQFADLIRFCDSQPNQTMHSIAEQLVYHQARVDKLKQFTATISKMPNFQQFVEASERCYQTFKSRCQQTLMDMIKTYTIKFYKTKYIKIDYTAGTYEIEQISMSQVLLAVLGLSQEQAQQFIMRKGMFEFVFSLEEFGMELHCLNLYNQNITKYSSDSMIKTFDGIDLQVKTNFHIFYNRDNTIAQKGGLLLTEFFMIVDYDITPNMLRQLVEIRKKEPNLEHIAYFENESDWDYAASSKQFIQQFYPHKI